MRLLPLLLPERTVGMGLSRVQGEDAEGKPGCRLKEEERGGIRKNAGQKREGNVPPAHVPALCRLPSDATHSAHYNKAVVCSAGSVQQGDKVLPLYQKQLQRGKKVLEQEISSFEFSLSLSLFPFFNPDSDSTFPPLVPCRRFCTIRNLYRCLWRPCRVRAWWGSAPRGPWPQRLAPRAVGGVCLTAMWLGGGEVLAVKVWSSHKPATQTGRGWRCGCQAAAEQAHG